MTTQNLNQLSKDQLEVILNGISDGVTVLDNQGEFIYVNDVGARLCGFSSAREMLDTPGHEIMERYELLTEGGDPFPVKNLPGRLALAGVTDPPETVVGFRVKGSGVDRWSIVQAKSVFDVCSKKTLVVSIFRDFTERKRMEDSARYLDEVSGFLNSSLDYEYTLSKVAELTVPKLADWCEVDIIGRDEKLPHVVAVRHSDPKMMNFAEEYKKKYPSNWSATTGVANVLRTGRSELYAVVTEEMLRQASRSAEHFKDMQFLNIKSVMLVPLVSRDKIFGVMTLVNSDSGRSFNAKDLKYAEELARRAGGAIENARLYADAELANKTKSLFLANMSHEIRTPLGIILGFTDMLMKLSLASEESLEYANIIKRNSIILMQLIDDILDISKVEAGRLDIENIEMSLERLISDVSLSMKARAREKSLEFTVILEEGLPDYIYSDPVRIKQVLNNLIGNAIKFTEKGFVKLEVKFIKKSNSEVLINFFIEDSGLGIPEEKRERVFDWFTQADSSTTRKYGGSGLGLALSRSLTQALGGNVSYIDKKNAGAVFLATISTELASRKSQLKISEPNKSLKGLSILVAEDVRENQILIESVLKSHGALVEFAENGQEALQKVTISNFDLILMDIQMPIMDGYLATEELRRLGYNKPIIAVTAHAMKSEQAKIIAAGCNGYVSKPIESSELLSVISNQFRTFAQ